MAKKEPRAKKRRKKRLKKSVKIFLSVFFIVLIVGSYYGYNYYISMITGPNEGIISDANPEEDMNKESDNLTDATEEEANYWILNAGDGEAIYIQLGQSDVLIDTGTSGSADKVVKTLEKNIRGKLDYVILTNGAAGRIGGVKALYKKVDVEHTIIGNLGNKESDVRKWIGNNGDIMNAKPTTLELDSGGTLSIFKPEVASKDARDQSLMTAFSYGDTRFVAESDAGPEEEAKLLTLVEDCDVLVLGRHGSDETNQVDLNERYTIASTGKKSGLPSTKLIEKKNSIFSTAKSGTIKFTSDSAVVDSNLENDDAIN